MITQPSSIHQGNMYFPQILSICFRFKDTSTEIREVCARDAGLILLRHSQLRGQVSGRYNVWFADKVIKAQSLNVELCLADTNLWGQTFLAALSSLTRDLDDSVRLTAVVCIIETARRKLDAVNESLIMACCDRMKDKKVERLCLFKYLRNASILGVLLYLLFTSSFLQPKIRHEVIAKLLCLYYKVIMSDEHTASETASVVIIPKKALALYMLASMTEEKWVSFRRRFSCRMRKSRFWPFRLMIERYFTSYIIPYKMEMPKRIKSMIDLFSKLDKFETQWVEVQLDMCISSTRSKSQICRRLELLSIAGNVDIHLWKEVLYRVFAEIVARSAVHRRILREMLDIISRQAASEDKAQLQSKIQRISSTHHDPTGVGCVRIWFIHHISQLLFSGRSRWLEKGGHIRGRGFRYKWVNENIFWNLSSWTRIWR